MEAKIILYEHENMKGRNKTFTESCSNLLDAGFDQTAVSVHVESGVWVLFQDHDFKGKIWVVMQGEKINYLRWFNKMARSIKLMKEYDFYAEPEVTIYEQNFNGHSLTLNDDVPNLDHYGFLRRVESVKVSRGAWIGYEGRDYAGSQTLFIEGNFAAAEKPPYDGGFRKDVVSAFRKIQLFPKGPLKLIKLDFDLDKAVILKTPRSVFQWTEVNDTKVEQTVSRTEEHTITRENTYEFRWNFGLKISNSLEVSVGIPEIGLGSKLAISVEKSLNIGSASGTKTSDIQHWIAEYPTKIPAKSKVILTSKLTEGKLNVPFVATLSRGEDDTCLEVQHGTFIGVQYFDLYTEFKQTPLKR